MGRYGKDGRDTGVNGIDGADGEDGVGVEYIFAVFRSDILPSSKYPLNSWTYDSPGTRDNLRWHDGAPTLTVTDAYLFRSERAVEGTPDQGDTVSANWSTPVVVGHFGRDGRPGRDGDGPASRVGIVHLYRGRHTPTFSTAVANTLFTAAGGYNLTTRLFGDRVTQYSPATGTATWSETRAWSGRAWVTFKEWIDGDLIVNGSISSIFDILVGNDIRSDDYTP